MWSKYIDKPVTAYVLPLVVFMLINALPGVIAIDNPMLPWWRYAPQHWIYPLQTVVVGSLLWYYWPKYVFAPVRGLWLATALGVLGIGIWLLPAEIYIQLFRAGIVVPEWCSWLGVAPRTNGFDPTVFQNSWAELHTLVWRFVRLVVVVPLIEEIFWRGFLMRYVQADNQSFEKIPFGKHAWSAFFIVTVCVILVHNSVDWLGALFFGSLMYYLAVRTRSLAACVVMHAVANLLLGIYVLCTKNWGFW